MGTIHQPRVAGGLATRVISASIMMPVALACVWIGYPWIVLLAAAAAAGMVWEWCRIIDKNEALRRAWLGVGIAGIAVLAAGFVSPLAGVLIILMSIGALMAIERRPPVWFIHLGFLWILLPCIGFVWLRGLPIIGFKLIVWLLVVVWTVDIAAYICGRSIGGAKLAPRISPNKTWAGLLGGVAGAIVAGSLVTGSLGFHDRLAFGIISGALGVIAQMGDLAESYVKRRFGVKDSGTLIPGHGGILDRLDGMLTAVAALSIMQLSGWDWN